MKANDNNDDYFFNMAWLLSGSTVYLSIWLAGWPAGWLAGCLRMHLCDSGSQSTASQPLAEGEPHSHESQKDQRTDRRSAKERCWFFLKALGLAVSPDLV